MYDSADPRHGASMPFPDSPFRTLLHGGFSVMLWDSGSVTILSRKTLIGVRAPIDVWRDLQDAIRIAFEKREAAGHEHCIFYPHEFYVDVKRGTDAIDIYDMGKGGGISLQMGMLRTIILAVDQAFKRRQEEWEAVRPSPNGCWKGISRGPITEQCDGW